MTFVNLLGIIFFVFMMIVGTFLRIKARNRLMAIDGFGGKYKKNGEKGKLIGKS